MRLWVAAIASLVVVSCSEAPREYPAVDFPESIAVAPLDQALTFARIEREDGYHVLAVSAFDTETVTGFILTEALGPEFDDPVAIFNAFGYDALRERIEGGFASALESVPAGELVLPLKLTDAHIAAGTNFAAHAEESAVEDGPFLFAKMVTPTPFNASVSAGDALLDYEVELAFVTLSDLTLPAVPEFMGVILTNDFTNRAALLRHINPDDVTSGDGFTTGKSAEGYLPVGSFLVIPRDLRTFVAGIDLKLAVNGELRQDANMTLAIWDIDELLRQAQARETVRWDYAGEEVSLPIDDGVVPARTLILAGTPEGTVFNGIPRGAMARGAGRWLAGGWGASMADHVIESYIAGERKRKRYLQPGDVVRIQVDRMGTIETTVEE